MASDSEYFHSEQMQQLDLQVASELYRLIDGIVVGSEFYIWPSDPLCYALEIYLTSPLKAKYLEWSEESFDGFFMARAKKDTLYSAHFFGTCILISDQTVTPFWIAMTLRRDFKSIESFRFLVGEPGGGPLGISGPECNSPEATELLKDLSDRIDSVDWVYEFVKQ